ncbi:LLM class F420-dependent oxidoreductase [Mycetocola zhujimingii]|uniref:LLM class F420-dependent oxidoreductase n=1 Tax=Mycetocola zhujimingii TaxID=2079792 RepID=A0A2U1THJ1_9MICO|nr:LLM class F420-dependent oxidoreductase [Mycetocola zhujimingii]PWC08345.1 LLM class F420-dependent oxidoreductase [Mycetocola zhujimingii]
MPVNPRPIRIAVQLQPQHATYEQIRESAAELEGLGVDILFNWDHFYPLNGDRDGLHFEAWTMLAALAEQTRRVELGTLVNCNSYRNANLQADMARTIDRISAHGTGQGRFIFGTGSGWFERDYDEYGYRFGTAGQRLDALAENLPVIADRWTKLNPPPTRKIPVLIGGAGEKKTLGIVAAHADIWHSYSDVSTLEHKLGVLAAHASVVGRNMAEIEISVGVLDSIADVSFADADRMRQLGASLFTIGLSGPNYDLSVVPDWLAWRDERNAA